MLEFLAGFLSREHPALVHLPLGMVVCLPVMVAAATRSRYPQTWRRMAFRVALIALAASLLALASGLLWGRRLAMIPGGSLLPQGIGPGQVLQAKLRAHELGAAAGCALGVLSLLLLRRAYHRPERWGWTFACLASTLAWTTAWTYTGRMGGVMVFGDADTTKAAAEALAVRKRDAEADLPLRALDYASLEPGRAAPFPSKAHGGRWARVWVSANGLDDYQAGRPLPVSAYAVLSTTEGRDGPPGPLYMREAKADGSQGFVFYWPRVPEARRGETGGEDFAYWRSPDPPLAVCTACHAGTAQGRHG